MPMKVSRGGSVPCRVVVCRDCGSPKMTGADHGERTARPAGDTPVRGTECPDVCEQANAVVVQPSSEWRAAGRRPVWVGLVDNSAATGDIAAWVRAGAPGLVELPDLLDLHLLTPPRHARAGTPRHRPPRRLHS
ncbi:(2Fe-2S) ferredoxin domain-containing protein [Streptomyces sp. NPDC049887]|uniref:(2Fe-2S) ferredoxin domain-containing protein n=1 Tax=unclassified Streptomyces TaxID=2593676 RepID=UPI003412BD06